MTLRFSSSAARMPLGVGFVLALCGSIVGCAGPRQSSSAVPDQVISGDAPALVGRPGQAVINGKVVNPPRIPMGDPRTIARIIEEGDRRSQIMAIHRELCERGPRLTGSTQLELDNHWTAEKFRSWGLTAEVVKWGEIATRFDRGPSYGRVMRKQERKNEAGETETTWVNGREMQLTTLAWTMGTDGPRRGKVVRMPETEEEYQKVKSELAGAWVLLKPIPTTGRTGVRGPGQRATDRWIARKDARDEVSKGKSVSEIALEERVIFDNIAGFIQTPKDERDRVWTTGVRGWRERPLDEITPDVEVTVRLSDYDFINSRLSDGEDVVVEFDLEHTLTPGPIPVYNTIAEIRGTEKPDEVVIICGHLDSWDGPGSQGAIDNGTGTAMTLEAARILMAAGARPKRTIRFCLWTGEEQGLLGAKAYVQSIKDQWPKISAVFNDDGGTNYQGGLKGTDAMTDMLAAATAPVNFVWTDSSNGKPMVVNIQPQGARFPRFAASDHYAFVEVGIPGFFWDEVGRADYGIGWHTQNDRFDLAIEEYLKQSAVCSAVTAYNLANAPTLLPRWNDSEGNAGPTLAPTNFGVQTR